LCGREKLLKNLGEELVSLYVATRLGRSVVRAPDLKSVKSPGSNPVLTTS